MKRQEVTVETFLRLSEKPAWKTVDVRTPREYLSGHMPEAESIPLFDDDERAEIGTLYKQQGREAAFLRGLDLVGPNMSAFVRQAADLSPEKKLLVHCWRGGMRSGSLATLWRAAGFEVITLEGGYKAYRRFLRENLSRPLNIIVLGGMTGSGKTAVLHALRDMGEQVIDLEGLAHHKGSVFGAIGEKPQPSTEQFENNLLQVVRHLDPEKPVWIEDESRMIGKVFVSNELWNQMASAPVLRLVVPRALRIRRLVEDYADGDPEEAKTAIQKISKRMDGKTVKEAVSALDRGDFATTADLVLGYYDKFYLKSLNQRPPETVNIIRITDPDPHQAAQQLLAIQPERT